MSKTTQLAVAAYDKAKAMGWKVYADFDLSDVLDVAGVVACDPGKPRCRVARWIEGQLQYSRWVITSGSDIYQILERELHRSDALG